MAYDRGSSLVSGRAITILLFTNIPNLERLAKELNLQEPPPPDCGERERLNRTRTWLMVVKADHSIALQFGKLPMVPLDSNIAHFFRTWYQSSSMSLSCDIDLCAAIDMMVVMDEFRRGFEQSAFSNVRKLPF